MYLDSVWSRNEAGSPVGGGSWLVTPPCRYYATASNARSDSFTGGTAIDVPVFSVSEGWSSEESAPHLYGNAWPWHSGRMNMAKIDGSARSIDPKQLSAGCDMLEDWHGKINDASKYIWDLR